MGKNFTKKLLPLALTAAMIVPSVPAMAAPSDIAGHWAESVITQWQSKGLIQGYADGTFKPNNTITRAEFVTLMNNAKGFWSEGSINFSDVKSGNWFYSAVAKAVAAGYVKGYSDGSFKPNSTITRAEAAVMIANAARLSANEAGAYRFTDVGSIPAWARGSVGAVVAAGYMTGYPDGSFNANASISRAEAVSSLNRMISGTTYQPTTPTTDNTNNTTSTTTDNSTTTTSDDVVIEDKGTTLKNQTVDGNVTIAKSVGNGDVTLRNVTIKGDLIVKGGGSNTVTLEDVDVRGKVRLLKEDVHLHLIGDTDISKLVIDLAARITKSSSYDGEIDEINLASDGDLSKTTRIDVPAKQLRIENQADLILGGDVEQLIVEEDAKGSEIEIKEDTTVDELSTDAKIKLTGEGRINLLDVSASGVTYDKDLDIRKTDTSNGATAPKEISSSTSTGGSGNSGNSGNSGTTSKEITGVAPITVEPAPYGTDAQAALKLIPTNITLNLKDGKTVPATTAEWNWADDVTYSGTTPGDYKATATVNIPTGYTYNGTLTATATVTVKKLDTDEFNKALKAADDKLALIMTTTAAEATKSGVIYILPDGTKEEDVTKDVEFIFADQAEYVALKAAHTEAVDYSGDSSKKTFDSQKACNEMTDKLEKATEAANKMTTKKGTKVTDEYIQNEIKKYLEGTTDQSSYLYYQDNSPLIPNTITAKDAYLPGWFNIPIADQTYYVRFEWKVNNGAPVTLYQRESGLGNSYYVQSMAATAPTQVYFTATATYEVNGSAVTCEIKNDEIFTATIGAPISVSADQPAAPLFSSGKDVTGTIEINLNGAEAITTVVNTDAISISGYTTTDDSSVHQINNPKITGGKKTTTGLSLDACISSGQLSEAYALGTALEADKTYRTGKVDITIPKDALTVDESTGWYLPDAGLQITGKEIWLCNPQLSVTTQEGSSTNLKNITVTAKYVNNAPVQVAYTTTNTAPDVNDLQTSDTIKVFVNIDPPQSKDSDGQVTYYKAGVSGFENLNDYYIWCRAGEGTSGAWMSAGHGEATSGGSEGGGESSGGSTTEGGSTEGGGESSETGE